MNHGSITQLRTSLVVLAVIAPSVLARAQQTTTGSLESQLQAQYKPASVAPDGTLKGLGTVLIIQKAGIFAFPTNSTGCPQVYMAQDGTLGAPGNGCTAPVGKRLTLQVGDKIYARKIDVDLQREKVLMTIVLAKSPGGSAQPLSYQGEIAFKYPPRYLEKADVSQVEDVINEVLAAEPADQGRERTQKPQTAQSQQAEAPLSNQDIIELVNEKVPPKAIVSLIQTAPETDFDVSKKGLIGLAQARVPEEIMEAMQGIVAGAAAPRTAAGATPSSSPQQEPYALLINGDQKPLSEREVSVVPTKGGLHCPKLIPYCEYLPKSIAYEWALPGKASAMVLATDIPTFEVTFDSVAGVDPEDFQPLLVKLEMTSDNRRLLGKSKAPENTLESDSESELYSSLKEEPVLSHLRPIKSGVVRLQCDSRLAPGEYALVLQPVSKSKKIIGSEIKNRSGVGLILTTAWDFSIQ